jgi:hypothetical protein
MRGASAFVLVLAVVTVMGCQTAAPPTIQPTATDVPDWSAPAVASQRPVASEAPGATPAPLTSLQLGPTAEPGEVIADIDFDFGAGTYDFPGPATALANLGGYDASLVVSFSGTEAGQPQQWTRTYAMAVAAGGAQRELTVTATGADADADAMHRFEMDGVAYELSPDGTCVASAVYAPDSLGQRWEPAGFLFGVRAATEAGTDTANGIDVSHYTFDERAFGPLPAADSTGEMWVASDGGYLVRYLTSTVGNADYFGEGIEGTVTLDYELTDVNAPAAILLPDACAGASLEVPTPPDATDVVRTASTLTFTTASSTDDVTAFYESELAALGWEPVSEAVVFEGGTSQDFTRDEKRLSLLITAGESATSVRFVIAAADPATPTP